jgi:hypothetical protein
MNRLDIINKLISKNNFKNYLEIGIYTGDVLNNCVAENKLGVDPNISNYRGNVKTINKTSDEYFKDIDDNKQFDIVFIDGMHESEQVYRDIENSVKHLTKNGIIVVHDCNPPEFKYICSYEDFIKFQLPAWNGNVYLGFVDFVKTYNMEYYTVDTDWGVGIIKPDNKLINKERVRISTDWNYFNNNRSSLLNLINVDSFNEIFLN